MGTMQNAAIEISRPCAGSSVAEELLKDERPTMGMNETVRSILKFVVTSFSAFGRFF
jgi:hypothetical protein